QGTPGVVEAALRHTGVPLPGLRRVGRQRPGIHLAAKDVRRALAVPAPAESSSRLRELAGRPTVRRVAAAVETGTMRPQKIRAVRCGSDTTTVASGLRNSDSNPFWFSGFVSRRRLQGGNELSFRKAL